MGGGSGQTRRRPGGQSETVMRVRRRACCVPPVGRGPGGGLLRLHGVHTVCTAECTARGCAAVAAAALTPPARRRPSGWPPGRPAGGVTPPPACRGRREWSGTPRARRALLSPPRPVRLCRGSGGLPAEPCVRRPPPLVCRPPPTLPPPRCRRARRRPARRSRRARAGAATPPTRADPTPALRLGASARASPLASASAAPRHRGGGGEGGGDWAVSLTRLPLFAGLAVLPPPSPTPPYVPPRLPSLYPPVTCGNGRRVPRCRAVLAGAHGEARPPPRPRLSCRWRRATGAPPLPPLPPTPHLPSRRCASPSSSPTICPPWSPARGGHLPAL